MAGGDPEWAESLRQDELRDADRDDLEAWTRLDFGARRVPWDMPERHEAEADR